MAKDRDRQQAATSADEAPPSETPAERREREALAKRVALTEWAGLDREAKNALAVEAAFAGDEALPRWHVSIPGDAAQPRLTLPARDEADAVARYDRLCGIRQCDHDHQVERAGAA